MNWSAYLKPGDLVVDVGANMGSLTREFVQHGCRVIAIEPQAELAASIAANGAETVISAAVGETVGETTLYHSRETPHASLWARNIVEPTGRTSTVRLVTLDHLRASGELPGPIRLIKVDTQGGEAAVLRGAVGVLATDRPLLFLEFWPMGLASAGSDYAHVCDWLADHGYQPSEFSTWQTVKDTLRGDEGHASHDVLVRAA